MTVWTASEYDQSIEEAVRFLSSIEPSDTYRRRLKAWHTYEALRMKTGGPPDPDVWDSTAPGCSG